MGVKIRNIEDQVPAVAGDDPAMLQGYMNAVAMTLLIVLVVVVGVWSMWIIPKVEPDAEVAGGNDKQKSIADKRKDSGKSKVGRNKEKKQLQKSPAAEKDDKAQVVPDVSEFSHQDDNNNYDDKAKISDGEEGEDWVDVPINNMKKSSVTFADDNIEMRDEEYDPPSDTSPKEISNKESNDKVGCRKKEKETPEQRQARLERKAHAKKQKEEQEAEEKRLFEEKLKASEMAARLQAEEDAKTKAEEEAKAAALARPDEADWVVHTKKADRRVKTFEELLEERMAKAAAVAADTKKGEVAEEVVMVGGENLTGSKKRTSSKSDSSNGSGKNNNKKSKGKKDLEVEGEAKVGGSNNSNSNSNSNIKKERKPRNDKRKDKKENAKGKQQQPQQQQHVLGPAAASDSIQSEQQTELTRQWGSLGKIVVEGDDPAQRNIGAPPGLTQIGADIPRFEGKERRDGGQLYTPPAPKAVHPSPGRGKPSPAAGIHPGGHPVPVVPSGGDALWSGAMDPLHSLPKLPLPRMSEAEAVYGNPHGSGVSIIHRPGSGPSSKENTPRVDYDSVGVISLSDLEKSLMSITK